MSSTIRLLCDLRDRYFTGCFAYCKPLSQSPTRTSIFSIRISPRDDRVVSRSRLLENVSSTRSSMCENDEKNRFRRASLRPCGAEAKVIKEYTVKVVIFPSQSKNQSAKKKSHFNHTWISKNLYACTRSTSPLRSSSCVKTFREPRARQFKRLT